MRQLERRQILRALGMGGATLVLQACGGGGGSSANGGGVMSAGGGITPSPAPSPAPTPIPPPIPTLRGVTIDQAEADIQSEMAAKIAWTEASRTYHSNVVVASPDELALALEAACGSRDDRAPLALNHRIICQWNGARALSEGPSGRIYVGAKLAASTHYREGGCVRIEAAQGYAPALENTLYIAGQGIQVEGITFVRAAQQGEASIGVSCVQLQANDYYPFEPMVHFRNCVFAAASQVGLDRAVPPGTDLANIDTTVWSKGINSQALADFVSVEKCRFIGLRIGAYIVARNTRMDCCDFRRLTGDALDLFGHDQHRDYYANAWVSRMTVRDHVDNWYNRSNHIDAIQICTATDIHRGYRLLLTDNYVHIGHTYTGEGGVGGGSQGFFGSKAEDTDNQFVIRRCVVLVTAPHGFAYYSPKATRPSFVDSSVFMRSGRTPSQFAPDPYRSQDYDTGITGSAAGAGDWLLVTNSVAANKFAGEGAQFSALEVDPRAGAATEQRPETIFVGRDFDRGGPESNGIAGKLGYRLRNEAGSQAAFVSDVWANFATRPEKQGLGIPDPSRLGWMG